MTFLERINQNYFNNGLSPEVLLLLGPVNNERVEVQNWVERMSRQMKNQRFRAQDFNELKAWVVGSFVTNLLPGAWRGFVPPITLKGRHAAIDDYMESNQWKHLKAGDHLLDLGCGFPPITTIDTSKRFPGVQITGADPSFGRYLVKDSNGDYACYDHETELLYFQPGLNEPDRWEKLFLDQEATNEYFKNHLIPALPKLPGNQNEMASVEHEGFTIIENPVLEYARSNLTFDQQGIGSPDLGNFQMVRCFNVLCYFNRSFRENTLAWMPTVLEEGGIFLTGMDWTRSRHARYAVYRNENGRLVPKEFAFSIENIRPLEIVAWFALHDDDYGTAAVAELVSTLRTDEEFCSSIDQRMDELLVRAGFKPRSENGYLGGLNETADRSTLDTVAEKVGRALEREGYAHRAVEVLNKAGYRAWINCVGHVAVNPQDLSV
jgi:hypothetical protein